MGRSSVIDGVLRLAAAGAICAFAAFSATAFGQERDLAAGVRRALEADDPFAVAAAPTTEPTVPAAPSAASAIVAADPATEYTVRALAASDAESLQVRERAARLVLAWDLAAAVRAGQTAPNAAYWLALDDLDRGYGGALRDKLLARAIPDADERVSALKTLALGREVAHMFSVDWNEMDGDEATTKRHAELRAALEAAGPSAVPYLADVLSAPPQAAFTMMHEVRGITARQQVRAVFGLSFLKATDALPFVLFHVTGPSFTCATNAQATVGVLTGERFGGGAADATDQEAATVARIEEWWAARRAEHLRETDELVLRVLRWTRGALRSENAEVEYYAPFGPRQLRSVVGRDFLFSEKGPLAERDLQLDRIEQSWLVDRASRPAAPARAGSGQPAPGGGVPTKPTVEDCLQRKVALSLGQTRLVDALGYLANASGVEIVISKGLEGRNRAGELAVVNLHLEETSVAQAFKILAKLTAVEWEIFDGKVVFHAVGETLDATTECFPVGPGVRSEK